MNTPSIAAQLQERGYKQPKRNGMAASPIGAKRRAMVRSEEGLYPTWEATLRLHGLEFWHCTVAQRSQPGWPDYAVFGTGWLAFVELKARSITTGRVGKLMPEQRRWRDAIELAGGEYRSFLLPDEWHDVDVWLNSKTSKGIWGTWRTGG